MVVRAFYKLIFYSDKDGRIVPDKLAHELGLQLNTIRKYLNALEKEGYVMRTGGIYVLTDKGKKFRDGVLNAITHTYYEPYIITDPLSGEPLKLMVKNYKQLYAAIAYELVDKHVIEEHILRGYLAQWVKNVVGDEYLYEQLVSGKIKTAEQLMSYLGEVLGLARTLGKNR